MKSAPQSQKRVRGAGSAPSRALEGQGQDADADQDGRQSAQRADQGDASEGAEQVP